MEERNHFTILSHFTIFLNFQKCALHPILNNFTSPVVLYALAGLACMPDSAPGCLGWSLACLGLAGPWSR